MICRMPPSPDAAALEELKLFNKGNSLSCNFSASEPGCLNASARGPTVSSQSQHAAEKARSLRLSFFWDSISISHADCTASARAFSIAKSVQDHQALRPIILSLSSSCILPAFEGRKEMQEAFNLSFK